MIGGYRGLIELDREFPIIAKAKGAGTTSALFNFLINSPVSPFGRGDFRGIPKNRFTVP